MITKSIYTNCNVIALALLINMKSAMAHFSSLSHISSQDVVGGSAIDVIITWTNFSSGLWHHLSSRHEVPHDPDRLSNNGELFINLAYLVSNPTVKHIHLLTLDGVDLSCMDIHNDKLIISKQIDLTDDLQTTSMGVESLISSLNVQSDYVIYLNDDMIMSKRTNITLPHLYKVFYWFESKIEKHTHQFTHNTMYILSSDFNIDELTIPNHRYHIFNFNFLRDCLKILSNRYRSLTQNKKRSFEDVNRGGSFYPVYVCQKLNIRGDKNIVEVKGIEEPKYWRDYRSTFLNQEFNFLCLQEMNNEPESFKQLIKQQVMSDVSIDLTLCGFTSIFHEYIMDLSILVD